MAMNKNRNQCKGITGTRKQCIIGQDLDDRGYCEHHAYFNNFTKEQIDKINSKSTDSKICSGCKHFHFCETKKCDNCLTATKTLRNQQKDGKKCNGETKESMPCVRDKINGTEYCRQHQYMINYTEEQLSNLTKCHKCRYKTIVPCNNCIDIKNKKGNDQVYSKDTKTSDKHDQKGMIDPENSKIKMCIYEDTNTKIKCTDLVINGKDYCKYHNQSEVFKVYVKSKGMKACVNYIRGCRIMLPPDYKNMKCDKCRESDRQKDNARYAKKQGLNKYMVYKYINIEPDEFTGYLKNIKDNISAAQHKKLLLFIEDLKNIEELDKFYNSTNNDIRLPILGYLRCINCGYHSPINECFTSKNDISHKCKRCILELREFDRTRDRSNRDYTIYEKQQRVREMRKQYRLDHPGNSSIYSKVYREKLRKIVGLDDMYDKSSEKVSEWIKNNPELMKEIKRKEGVILGKKMRYYKINAKKRNVRFNLTEEDIIRLSNDNCYYCGELPRLRTNLHGIDRRDSDGDYTLENSVSCCRMCNFMKGGRWNDFEFLLIAEHILTTHGFFNGNLYPELFNEHIPEGYTTFIKAKKNHKSYLTREEYDLIKREKCYICHKENSETHINGIDRVNTKVCYIKQNCRACCGDCNRMKCAYELSDLIEKLYRIYMFMNKKNCILDDDYNTKYNRFFDSVNPNVNPTIKLTDYLSEKYIDEKDDNDIFGRKNMKNKFYKKYNEDIEVNEEKYDGIKLNDEDKDINVEELIKDKDFDGYDLLSTDECEATPEKEDNNSDEEFNLKYRTKKEKPEPIKLINLDKKDADESTRYLDNLSKTHQNIKKTSICEKEEDTNSDDDLILKYPTKKEEPEIIKLSVLDKKDADKAVKYFDDLKKTNQNIQKKSICEKEEDTNSDDDLILKHPTKKEEPEIMTPSNQDKKASRGRPKIDPELKLRNARIANLAYKNKKRVEQGKPPKQYDMEKIGLPRKKLTADEVKASKNLRNKIYYLQKKEKNKKTNKSDNE